MTSETPLHQLLRALVRFWWVAIVGIVLAALVFVLATYRVSLGVPPSFDARAQSTYSASTQVLITSKREPYLSATNVNAKIIQLPSTSDTATGTAGTGSTGAPTQTSTYDSGSGADGDLQRLVEIANDLPPRVTSDPVIRLRNEKFGRIEGSVTAVNPYAFSGAGGFRSGPLPYIKITGTANSQQDALDITNRTALAFKTWFEGRQAAAQIKSADRVLVEQVNSADTAFPQGGSKPLLGVGAALLVLLGVAGLVLALDRLIPFTAKPRRGAGTVEPRERPAPERPAAVAPERVIVAERPVAERELPEYARPERNGPTRPAAEPAFTAELKPEDMAEVKPGLEPEVKPAAEATPEPAQSGLELPALEVPTMKFGAVVEDAANGTKPANGKKPTSRQRKGTSNGSATPRRRTASSTPKTTAPPNNSDDAS